MNCYLLRGNQHVELKKLNVLKTSKYILLLSAIETDII